MRRKGPIVVVDDDADDQYLYKQVFENLHVENEVISFYDGTDALKYLTETSEEPFLILCDINMPKMSGLELREEICKRPDLINKNTPFIFLSTSARQGDMERASELYTHGFFVKEVSYQKHEKTLRRIVEYWNNCTYAERVVA